MVHKLVDDSLKSFAHMVWGNSQAIIKYDDTAQVEYIDLTGYTDTFRFLLAGQMPHKVLIRQEYRVALEELKTSLMYRNGTYVTGNSGIGKSLFLVYILVKRLGEKLPVVWEVRGSGSRYVLFRETANVHDLTDTTPVYQLGLPDIWVLSDSDAAVSSPSSAFTWFPLRVRTIQATPPERERWKGWSKYSGAEGYIMDVWEVDEIVALAKLLELDIERITFLAEQWGGIPRSLLRSLEVEESDAHIEREYACQAGMAVQHSEVLLYSVEAYHAFPDYASELFYFCRPGGRFSDTGTRHMYARAVVPTANLRRRLGEALWRRDKQVRLNFFRALAQFDDTRQTAYNIYENWFHSFISAGKTIKCRWVQDPIGVPSLAGKTLIPTTDTTPKGLQPPFYWVAPKSFPGIDSVLVSDGAIYAFRVNFCSRDASLVEGLQRVREYLPDHLKGLPWRMVFVGNTEEIERTANKWANRVTFPTETIHVPVGWSVLDPVVTGVTYLALRDESSPAVPELPGVGPDEALDDGPVNVEG